MRDLYSNLGYIAEELLSLHQETGNSEDNTANTNEDERPLYGLCDCQDGLISEISVQLFKKMALGTSNSTLDVGTGETSTSQNFGKICSSSGLEDLAGNDESNNTATNLGDILEG